MTRMRSVAMRELRAYFNSPIAYVFLLAFTGAALFTFFNVNAFFARGQADLRALFSAVPFLMLLLVPALTMRLWAEEEKQGTIEMLLTLPVRDHELVAGKFLASWALLGVGLALTLPLVIVIFCMATSVAAAISNGLTSGISCPSTAKPLPSMVNPISRMSLLMGLVASVRGMSLVRLNL